MFIIFRKFECTFFRLSNATRMRKKYVRIVLNHNSQVKISCRIYFRCDGQQSIYKRIYSNPYTNQCSRTFQMIFPFRDTCCIHSATFKYMIHNNNEASLVRWFHFAYLSLKFGQFIQWITTNNSSL